MAISGNGQPFLEMKYAISGNGSLFLVMVIPGNGWAFLKMDGHSWRWTAIPGNS